MAQALEEFACSSVEKTRVRELYQYFPISGNPSERVEKAPDTGVKSASLGPVLSSDGVLTALAQLSALRVNCDRAFISLIDSKEQHIIAEATRSISLTDSNNHSPNDGLSFGAMKLDLMEGVCGGTISVLTGQNCTAAIHTDNIFADQTRYVINDFTKEEQYKDRAYVRGFPFMRFYADVPIKTDSGLVMGSLALVDSKPRPGLSAEHYSILVDIAATIMEHLKLLKISREHDRAGRLLHGLKCYVQPTTTPPYFEHGDDHPLSLRSWPSDDESNISKYANSEPMRFAGNFASKFGTREGKRSSEDDKTTSFKDHSPDILPLMGMTASNEIRQNQSSATEPPKNSYSVPVTKNAGGELRQLETEHTRDSTKNRSDSQTGSSYSTAAAILSKAMDLEGVVFLGSGSVDIATDAQGEGESDMFKSMTESLKNYHGSPIQDNFHASSPETVRHGPTIARNGHAQRLCAKLGGNIRIQSDESDTDSKADLHNLPQHIHKLLHTRFPGGTILIVDQKATEESIGPHFLEVQETLRLCFPKASSILYMPIRGSKKSERLIGSFGWTHTPQRVFSTEDLAHFTACVSMIAAEMMRLELAREDRMKTDFISSISHEFRSPLHGILGCVELLLEESIPASQRDVLKMINKCGKSLLDTLEHILVYCKINTQTTDRRRRLERTISSNAIGNAGYESHSTFDLASLVEDTVESSNTGHERRSSLSDSIAVTQDQYQKANAVSDMSPQRPISIILSIEAAPTWVIKSEAGAWRRIIMNLLGNAIKYTAAGFVEISLRCAAHNDSSKDRGSTSMALLSIKDSGCGISKQYLQNHLYTPFSQEDALVDGAGLGLSIVHQLVSSLHGSIDVQSEKGQGTCFVVSIPIDFKPRADEVSTFTSIRPSLEARRLCLVSTQLQLGSRNLPTKTSLASRTAMAEQTAISLQAQQWFGMTVTSFQNVDQLVGDILIVDEEEFPGLQLDERYRYDRERIPILVLCKENAAAHELDQTHKNVHYLRRPIGPRRLAEALYTCLGLSNISKHLPISSQSSIKEIQMEKTSKYVHVLLVDDNAINLKILIACVKKLCCIYETAINGLEALERYKSASQPFDFVFMDISMPVMDGYASTRAIREFEVTQKRRRSTIVALTGLGSSEAEQKGMDCGMDIFLTKPLPMQRVKTLILEKNHLLEANS